MRECRFDQAGLGARAIVIDAAINAVPLVLEVDTGASGLFVVGDSEVGRLLATAPDGASGTSVSAAGAQSVRRIAECALDVGAMRLETSVTLMPGSKDAHCGYTGRIGIEQLRNCALRFGAKDQLRCTSGQAAVSSKPRGRH